MIITDSVLRTLLVIYHFMFSVYMELLTKVGLHIPIMGGPASGFPLSTSTPTNQTHCFLIRIPVEYNLVHTCFVIAILIVSSVKTECESKIVIVITVISSVVSIAIVSSQRECFFLRLQLRRLWSGMNCFNVIASAGAHLMGSCERSHRSGNIRADQSQNTTSFESCIFEKWEDFQTWLQIPQAFNVFLQDPIRWSLSLR